MFGYIEKVNYQCSTGQHLIKTVPLVNNDTNPSESFQIPKCHHVPVRRLGAILTSEDYVRYFLRHHLFTYGLRYLPAPNKDWHFKIQKKVIVKNLVWM